MTAYNGSQVRPGVLIHRLPPSRLLSRTAALFCPATGGSLPANFATPCTPLDAGKRPPRLLPPQLSLPALRAAAAFMQTVPPHMHPSLLSQKPFPTASSLRSCPYLSCKRWQLPCRPPPRCWACRC